MKSWRSIARTIVSAVMLILFAYGAGRFSDGPIGACASGYCSARHLHLPHTPADYRAYKAWEMTILIVWPLGLAALFLLQREKTKGSDSDARGTGQGLTTGLIFQTDPRPPLG